MINESKVRDLISPFDLHLNGHQVGQLLAYLSLLLRWNSRINLTSIRNEEVCVTRHFGESLYLGRCASLKGRFFDIGSGAGFPGLALKITFPELVATLLEPNGRKRAFLKEVVRVCGMGDVEVRRERLDEYVSVAAKSPFDFATSRAVGALGELVSMASKCVTVGGRLFLWLGSEQGTTVSQEAMAQGEDTERIVKWTCLARVPLSRSREIWCGDVHSLRSPQAPVMQGTRGCV